MRGAPEPPDEAIRIAQLRATALLDSDSDERFDRVTRLAQRLFDVPIALVSLVDVDRQWFKSHAGLDVSETPRSESFCAHAILDDSIMHVPDATADPRFATNPLVLEAPEIRFYAGCPIRGPEGAKLGTLCIIDREPRGLSDEDARSLRDLADMVEREIASVQLAIRDELTGLSNRRGFDLLASKVLSVCRRRGLPATLLYIDLDGFKAINDGLGHDAGDVALRDFASLLARTFRGSDVIARLGGDEFGVLLTGTTSADEAIGRLRDALDVRTTEMAHPLAVSVGIARFDPSDPESLVQLAARADAAMYAEKRAHHRLS